MIVARNKNKEAIKGALEGMAIGSIPSSYICANLMRKHDNLSTSIPLAVLATSATIGAGLRLRKYKKEYDNIKK